MGYTDIIVFTLLCCIGIKLGSGVNVSAPFIKLDNGCTWNSSEIKRHTWFDFKAPLLNCSHLNLRQINFTGVPNTTASIDLSYNRLTTLDIADLKIFKNLKRLELIKNNLDTLIGNESIQFPNVTQIALSQNSLVGIPQQWLASFPNLLYLTIYSNKITQIKTTDFSQNKNIKALGIGPNPLEKSDDFDWLKNFNVSYLAVNKMGLTKVPKHIAKMSDLVFLSLSGNNIPTIQNNAFSQCSKLKYLEMAQSKIKTLEPFAFKGMFGLTSIDLSDNLLTTLPNGVFNDMENERVEIQLYENPLNCSCDLTWFKRWTNQLESQDLSTEIHYKCAQPQRNHGKKSYQLKISDFTCHAQDTPWIDCNKPSEIPTESPTEEPVLSCPEKCICYNKEGEQYYPKVNSVDDNTPLPQRNTHTWINGYQFPLVNCVNKTLTSFPKKIPESVQTLILANNRIKKLDMENLLRFKSLQVLDLDDNGMTEFKPSNKVVLDSVHKLSVRSNQLTNISSAHLKSFPSLKTLRIYDNKIASFDKNVFSNLRNLTYLYIGPNPLKKFDSGILDGLNPRVLGLRNTNLKTIPIQIRKMNALIYTDLSDNQITKVDGFTFPEGLTYLRLDNNKINEISPKAFKGAGQLRNIDFSENKLVTLPKGIFDDIFYERLQIRIWQNPITCNCTMAWFKKWIEEANAVDSMSEVKFVCNTPQRVHGTHSDAIKWKDFVCNDDDVPFDVSMCAMDYTGYHTRGQMALAVLLTLLFTFAITAFCCRCCCGANNKRVRYSRQANLSSTQLDLDMD